MGKELLEADLYRKYLVDRGDDSDRFERMPAELEEVMIGADLL